MMRRPIRSLGVALALGVALPATNAGAAPVNAASVLAHALADGAHQKSVTLSGTFTGSGMTGIVDIAYTPAAFGGFTTVSSLGTEYIVEPAGKKYCFVKASSLGVIKQALEVKKPTTFELNLWYKVTVKDRRYAFIATPSGAHTVAQMFSFTPAGWSSKVTYEGVHKLDGVRVYKLKGASNTFVTGTGFATTTLYVTDAKDPLPYAISGPAGTSGLLYFTKWNTTTVAVPFSDVNLPK